MPLDIGSEPCVVDEGFNSLALIECLGISTEKLNEKPMVEKVDILEKGKVGLAYGLDNLFFSCGLMTLCLVISF